MRGRPFRYVVCFLYLFFGTNAYSHQSSHQSQNVLNRLLGTHSSKPVVVYLNLGSKARSPDYDYGTESDVGLSDPNEGSYGAERHHHESSSSSEYDESYFLHHLLKPSHGAMSTSSSSSEDSMEPAKLALRTALRVRCQKVDKCARQCPPKKPSCPMNCQEVFDSLNLCPPPPPPDPCDGKKPKCGRTMPPHWLF